MQVDNQSGPQSVNVQNHTILKNIRRPDPYPNPDSKKVQDPKDWFRTIQDHFALAGYEGDVGLPFSAFLTGTTQKWFNKMRDAAELTGRVLDIATIKKEFLTRYNPSITTEEEVARLQLLGGFINMTAYPNYNDYENAFTDATTTCNMATSEQSSLFLSGLTTEMRESVAYHPITREMIRDIGELINISRRESDRDRDRE